MQSDAHDAAKEIIQSRKPKLCNVSLFILATIVFILPKHQISYWQSYMRNAEKESLKSKHASAICNHEGGKDGNTVFAMSNRVTITHCVCGGSSCVKRWWIALSSV